MRTLVAEETRLGMLVGVAVGLELAEELAKTTDRGEDLPMNIRWLGHAAFELEADGTTVLIDPFLTGTRRRPRAPTSSTPNAILLTHGHGDHYGDIVVDRQAHRRDGRRDHRARRTSWPRSSARTTRSSTRTWAARSS